MGLLSFFNKSGSTLIRLPSGSFTVDSGGHVIASTLPQSFPVAMTRDIAHLVLETFRSARKANLPLSELVAEYSALKLTARELRGGAIIFLAPLGFTPSKS